MNRSGRKVLRVRLVGCVVEVWVRREVVVGFSIQPFGGIMRVNVGVLSVLVVW